MSSDIEFGEVQHAEPKRGIRPDQDAHYSVVPVGHVAEPDSEVEPAIYDPAHNEHGLGPSIDVTKLVNDDDLLIFVDLDVLRDMESHARSNTSVELGGVMLGYQKIDQNGRPFVVVTDSLRAEHYEATKGSFKFTHDTWGQITDQRSEFHPELEMVGWYHTHPGWSVFLSGMDLFICDNFFNRPLDVALVIDPVAHDRGWFQWTTKEPQKKTRRTDTFFLISNRYRQDEVEHFAHIYRDGHNMVDPRYSSQGSIGSSQPIVNIMDNRKPIIDVAIIAMLTMQFLVVCVLAWRILIPVTEPVAQAQDSLAVIERDRAYTEILQTIVSKQGNGATDVVANYADLKTEKKRLLASLDGQIANLEKVQNQRDQLQSSLEGQTELSNKLSKQLADSRLKINELEENIEAQAKVIDSSQDGSSSGEQGNNLWWWVGGVLASIIIGAIGFLFGNQRGKMAAYDEVEGFEQSKDATKKMSASSKTSNQVVDSDVDNTDNPGSINFGDD